MLGTPQSDRIARRRAATRREITAAAWAVAREQGLAQMSLRDVADRVGMRAPSLYTHVDSKAAIYDAMFAEAWQTYLELVEADLDQMPESPRGVLRRGAHHFFAFAVADLTRYQLMNQPVIPGWEPSPEAYAPSVATRALMERLLTARGLTAADIDLFVALTGGLVNAQLANDPGGDRWGRLVDRAVDMLADQIGLAPDDLTAPTTTPPTQPNSTTT